MLTDKALRSPVHGLVVEHDRHMPDVRPIERSWRAAGQNEVLVDPSLGRKSGMERVIYWLDQKNRDGLGLEMIIQPVSNRVPSEALGHVEVGDLTGGMDASICAPRTEHRDGLTGQREDGPFERRLN